jgi:murein DD-endopeptidase MepM/ murein hydrolase activator NlpD
MRFVFVIAAIGLLAACTRSGPPAPVTLGSARPTAPSATIAPATSPVGAPIAPGSSYTVRDGDTLFTVARRAGVPTRALIDANRLVPPYAIETGARLTIPNVRTHEVRAGDTASQLAQRYGVPLRELVRANGIEPPFSIRVGQRLIIPQRADSPVVSSVAVAPVQTVVSAPNPPPVAIAPSAPVQPTNAQPTPASAPAISQIPTASPSTVQFAPPQLAAVPPPAPAPANPLAAPVDSGAVGRLLWPVRGVVVSDFGPKAGGLQNDGINIAAPRGTPFRAADSGVVIYAGNELRGFGNLLLLRHEGGTVTAYAHADELLVQRGETVRRGQTIGRVGATGNVSTPQLHFEVRRGTRAANPAEFLGSATASN